MKWKIKCVKRSNVEEKFWLEAISRLLAAVDPLGQVLSYVYFEDEPRDEQRLTRVRTHQFCALTIRS